MTNEARPLREQDRAHNDEGCTGRAPPGEGVAKEQNPEDEDERDTEPVERGNAGYRAVLERDKVEEPGRGAGEPGQGDEEERAVVDIADAAELAECRGGYD